MFIIHFENVGRYNQSWTHKTSVLDLSELAIQAKKKGLLATKDIEIDIDMKSREGGVFVLGYRKVGHISIQIVEDEDG